MHTIWVQDESTELLVLPACFPNARIRTDGSFPDFGLGECSLNRQLCEFSSNEFQTYSAKNK